MPLTPSKSAQYANATASPVVPVPSSDWNSKVRMSFGKLTFTLAGQGVAQILRLPAGKVRVAVDNSRVVCPAGVAGATLSLGHASYVNAAGATIAADGIALLNAQVITAAIDMAPTLPAGGFLEFDSRFGVDIEATVATQNSPAAGDLVVSLQYQMGN